MKDAEELGPEDPRILLARIEHLYVTPLWGLVEGEIPAAAMPVIRRAYAIDPENEDIARANAIISVPVNPEFPSLNLAQCVLLTAYEWRRATEEVTSETTEMAGTDWASQIEVEKLAEHYEDRLSEAGFFFPATKADGMKRTLRNLWSRMPLTRADVQVFHGILRRFSEQ